MVRGIKAIAYWKAIAATPPADIAAIEDLLLRVARLVEEVPEIAELDLNQSSRCHRGACQSSTRGIRASKNNLPSRLQSVRCLLRHQLNSPAVFRVSRRIPMDRFLPGRFFLIVNAP